MYSQVKKVNSEDLEIKVKQMYKDVAEHPERKYHFEMGRGLAERLGYPGTLLDQLPTAAIDSFAGVGYYFGLAEIKKGDNIVDLGSGSGMDAFCASLLTGISGEVIGIDMTDAQLQKAERLRVESEITNVIFRKAYIEELPVVSHSVDVVISNGVINLTSDKSRVFNESARVLKRGGKLAISDIVSAVELPASISCNPTYWAACIGGAMQEDMYLNKIKAAGFEIINVVDNPYSFISNSATGATKDYGIKSISVLAIKK
jgi:SAM-dependent methyltransferase